MDQHDSFVALAQRLRAGDQDAAAQVVRRFTGRLIALARAELDARIRAKVDPEDVVQSAYRSFFTRCDAGPFDCATWDELWSLLALITLRKCFNRLAYFRAQCRDVASEVVPGAREEEGEGLWQAIDREPTPPEAAILAETVEQLLRGVDPDDRAIVELSLQGYSAQEVGARLGRAERTVRRVRELIKRRLRRMQEHDLHDRVG
jgi:RNA polymerase sigma-70 factor (ECF subfamily)